MKKSRLSTKIALPGKQYAICHSYCGKPIGTRIHDIPNGAISSDIESGP